MGGWGKINNIKDDFLPTTLFSMEAFLFPFNEHRGKRLESWGGGPLLLLKRSSQNQSDNCI